MTRRYKIMAWFGCLFAINLLWVAYGFSQSTFEVAALVDSYDFAAVRDTQGQLLFDTETPAGNTALLEHVLETGANTILWRNCGGATMRYQSEEEFFPMVESPLDKRRLPSSRPVYGWLRYFSAEPDILQHIFTVCRERNLEPGVHWPFEETHWAGWTFGGWNLEHPQFWGVTAQGQIWAGRCSLAFPEVVEHKLRLTDELLQRGMRSLFIDIRRSGGWSPAYEYVEPEVARWRALYNCDPPVDARDPRWCQHIAQTTHAYFTKIANHLRQSDTPARFMLGVVGVKNTTDTNDSMLLNYGIDWRRLVCEGYVDVVVIYDIDWDVKRPFESTRERVRELRALTRGRCKLLLPLSMYNFTNKGAPAYQKATGLSLTETTRTLIRMAWEEGADGINLECVDYNNYPTAMRSAMRETLAEISNLTTFKE